jgi:hypothetical protein
VRRLFSTFSGSLERKEEEEEEREGRGGVIDDNDCFI